MKRIVVLGIVFAVIVAGAGTAWFVLQRELPGSDWPERAVELEEALALPGLIGLAAVDVRDVVRAQQLAGVEETAGSPEERRSWFGLLAKAGIDWRSQVHQLIAGVYAREEGVGFALAAFGSFSPRELEIALRASPEFEVETALLNGRELLQLSVRDRATCEVSGPWLLHADAERLIVADPDTLDAVLSAAPRSASASQELERFRGFRSGRLASLALFRPGDVPIRVSNPMLGMALSAATEKLDGFESLTLGASLKWLPPGVQLTSVLEASDAALAEQTAKRWNGALASSRQRLSAELPIAGALLDALQISARGDALWLETDFDRELAAQLEKLPSELVAAAFGGPDLEAMASLASVPPEEQLATDVHDFAAVHAVETIPTYDATVGFAGAVDTQSGPFGVRLLSLALPSDATRGVELAVEAIGTGLTNIGEQGERAQLRVTSVRGRAGQELLAVEACGVDRNELPIALSGFGASSPLAGVKRVRLVPGAQVSDIAFVEGHVKLVYPTHTETVSLESPRKGSSAARNGTRLELTDLRAGSVAWKLEGNAANLLQLRARNAAGQVLMKQSSMQMGAMFGAGNGNSGSSDFAGAIARLDAIFATGEEAWEFPFALTQLRPGTNGEQTGGVPSEFVNFPLDRIRRDFANVTRDLTRQDAPPAEAETETGPFVVALEGLWSFGGLMPRFEVRSPAIPNLEQSLGALELRLQEVRLKDGTIELPRADAVAGWSQRLSLSEAWNSPGLRADASLETRADVHGDEVASLSGALVLRVPKGTSTLQFSEVALGAELQAEGFSAIVSELARDRFVLKGSEGGERLLAVRAYNGAGEPLWMTGASSERDSAGWHGEFGVQGVPARIEVVIASELETAEYPFAMQLAKN